MDEDCPYDYICVSKGFRVGLEQMIAEKPDISTSDRQKLQFILEELPIHYQDAGVQLVLVPQSISEHPVRMSMEVPKDLDFLRALYDGLHEVFRAYTIPAFLYATLGNCVEDIEPALDDDFKNAIELANDLCEKDPEINMCWDRKEYSIVK